MVRKIKHMMKTGGKILAGAVLIVSLFTAVPKSNAYTCPTGCACTFAAHAVTAALIGVQWALTTAYFEVEMQLHERLFLDLDLIQGKVIPGLQSLSEQLTATTVHTTATIGAFFDAKIQMDTQLLLQELETEAYKDYTPSPGMCTIGTSARALAATDYNKNLTKMMLSERALDRELGSINTSGRKGRVTDRIGRLKQFKQDYCTISDNNYVSNISRSGLALICEADVPMRKMNKDIDYFRTVIQPKTIKASFRGGDIGPENEDIIAMSSNLYGNELPSNIGRNTLETIQAREPYLEMRSVAAKRSVARNSFNSIAALKSMSPTETAAAPHMARLLVNLGVPEHEATSLMISRPSYLAQLEIMAKRIYQQPQFYTELYDKPANVKRKSVAIQAIDLMVNRDIYESYLRSEAILAVLLETQLLPVQDDLENEIARLEGRGEQ